MKTCARETVVREGRGPGSSEENPTKKETSSPESLLHSSLRKRRKKGQGHGSWGDRFSSEVEKGEKKEGRRQRRLAEMPHSYGVISSTAYGTVYVLQRENSSSGRSHFAVRGKLEGNYQHLQKGKGINGADGAGGKNMAKTTHG